MKYLSLMSAVLLAIAPHSFVQATDCELMFIHDTPMVAGSTVTAYVGFGANFASVRCRIRGLPWTDCSSGTFMVTSLDPSETEKFEIQIVGCLPSNPRRVRLTRWFFLDSISDCRAHLINNGITIDTTAETVTIEWQGTGAGNTAGLLFECKLKGVTGYVPCSSPHPFSITGLPSGIYYIHIRFIDTTGTVCPLVNGAHFKFKI